MKVSSHWHVGIPSSELKRLLYHGDFPLAFSVRKRPRVAGLQEAKSGAFFLLRNCNSVWLCRAVYSSQDSRCVWMVQNTFCHFHRLCSTITSPSLQMNCCACLLYYLCQGTWREKFKYKGDRIEIEGTPILTICGVLCFRKLLKMIIYFSFQPYAKTQNNACCWKACWEEQFQSCWEGFLSHPQQEGCDQAPESCVITAYKGKHQY